MEPIVRVRDPSGIPRLAVERNGEYEAIEPPERLRTLEGVIFEACEPGRPLGSRDELEVLAPTSPTKIVCVGRNYRRHAEELGNPIPEEPLIFLKPPSSLIGDGTPIRLPERSEEVHHEAELACVVGERASDGTEVDPGVVAGYTCANDVTARDLQRTDKTFTRSKGYDTFCPVGPGLAPADRWNPAEHEIACHVDGTQRQSARLDGFIFSIEEVVAFVADVMTLEPGDLLLTGTPSGVGPLVPGSTVEVTIGGIGTLSNPVVRR